MTSTIQSKSIYHGLPVLSDPEEGLTAIVTGSNGISGFHQLKVLSGSPQRWKKIYAISRRPPHGQLPSNVEHVSMDLLQSPEDIAAQLSERGVNADYAFFFAYIQPKPKESEGIWSAAEDLVTVNTKLLSNFLEGLERNKTIPRRILLQLGAKYYGLHEGPAIGPQEESDPRYVGQPNFYYAREDYLKAFAEVHGISWNTTRPSHTIGAVPDAAMNLCYPLAIYATIQKYLDKPLAYPGDPTAWDQSVSLSSARANAYLTEWIALTNHVGNESFNAVDDSIFTWSKFWPKLAQHFHMPWEGPDTSDRATYETVTLPTRAPRGYGSPGELRYSFSLTEWAKRPEIQKAWREIAEANGLREKELKDVDRVFGFTDMAVGLTYPIRLSMAKARKSGYFGFVDSAESILQVMEEFVDLDMIPSFL